MKTERIIVSNHKNGPWKQSVNFRRLQDAAMEYFSSANANDELYLLLYLYIVVDFWRGQIPSDMGTSELYDFAWRMLPDFECCSRMGESTKGCRWSTRPLVRAHDEVRFRHFARAVVLRHFIGVVHQYVRCSTAGRVPPRRFHR